MIFLELNEDFFVVGSHGDQLTSQSRRKDVGIADGTGADLRRSHGWEDGQLREIAAMWMYRGARRGGGKH